MIFLSASTFLAGDSMSVSYSPTAIDKITNVQLMNGEFENLYAYGLVDCHDYDSESKFPETGEEDDTYVARDTGLCYKYDDGEYVEVAGSDDDFDAEWDFNTILNADYETEKPAAGNVAWSLSTINYVLIKRKINDPNVYTWTTLLAKEINSQEDLESQIKFTDYTPTNGTWAYAAVPVLNMNEGDYSTTTVDVSIDKLVIIDSKEIHSTYFTDGNVSVTCLENPGVYTTMYNKYPTVVYNSDANYKTVGFTSSWYPETDCALDCIDDDKTRIDYLDIILKFLTNRRTKLIKCVDGRRFLVQITTLPSVSAGDTYQILSVEFEGTEVGDPDSDSALYSAGLITATSEWWES